MAEYPNNIYTGREVENLPGIAYNENDKTTIFAEDIGGLNDEVHAIEQTLGENPQGDFDTVADRLAAGGGGGGAWEEIFNYTTSGSETEIVCDTLDLTSDKVYKIYFGIWCQYDSTNIEVFGNYLLTMGWQGVRWESGTATGQFGVPFLSHQSIGAGVGEMMLAATPNGSAGGLLNYTVSNQRMYQFNGMDNNAWTGGESLKKIRLFGAGGNNLDAGSYMQILRRVY